MVDRDGLIVAQEFNACFIVGFRLETCDDCHGADVREEFSVQLNFGHLFTFSWNVSGYKRRQVENQGSSPESRGSTRPIGAFSQSLDYICDGDALPVG